ncbi:MAG: PAS domain-containing sensor histidine kinase, partial [Candidatus Omnitrophica bacterium]|nr:PAS domain-containing sensor histidine kinase [Candidatus Omnitrophota bacterium]
LEQKITETGAQVKIAASFPSFKVDRLWAVQAVYNLVSNAIKYAKQGQPPEIDIEPYESGNELGIIVKDRGIGIESVYHNRIFELFQRAVGREIEGTGAGLAIVKEIAKKHGGSAWVRSRDDGGSEFIITFKA